MSPQARWQRLGRTGRRRRREQREAWRRSIEERRREVDALFNEFEALLMRHGARVPTGSTLEEALLFARQLHYIRREGAPLPDLEPNEEDDMFRRVAWLWAMAPKLIRLEGHPDFGEIVPHLRLVVQGEFAQSVPG